MTNTAARLKSTWARCCKAPNVKERVDKFNKKKQKNIEELQAQLEACEQELLRTVTNSRY